VSQYTPSQYTPGQAAPGQAMLGQAVPRQAITSRLMMGQAALGLIAPAGADSEVGRLRTVLMHRPGLELKRITPRTRHLLQLDGLPWPARAQQEHDALAEVLRTRGVEVIYLAELLQDVLEYQAARDESITAVLAGSELGDELSAVVSRHLETRPPEDLASILVAGLTTDELRAGKGLVYDLLTPRDFILEPLPNLAFSRDACVWVNDQVVLGTLSGPRRREADLLAVIYGHHPRFNGLSLPYRVGGTRLDGGDILLLGPGVVAVGVGARSSPAAAELLAKYLLETGAAHTVLAVPMSQPHQLDTVCTVLDHGVVLMVPALAFTLTALTITRRGGSPHVSRPQPFLEAAARALSIDRLTMIETGIDSMTGARGQWEDGANTLAIGDRVLVCDERNTETNSRLAAAGYEVIAVPCGELGGVRGGPRCLCAPLARDPQADDSLASDPQGAASPAPRLAPLRG
jgi:arginine deiminase